MSRIRVAESSESLVIASDKGGTGMNAAGKLDQAAVDAKTEFGHCVRFVDVRTGEEFRAKLAKNLLRDDEDAAIVLAASGGVKKAE